MFDFSIRRILSITLTLISAGVLSPVAANAIEDKKVERDLSLIFDELIVLHKDVANLHQRVKILEKEKLLKDWQDDDKSTIYFFTPTNSVQPEQKLESPECKYEKNAPWVLKEVK